MWGGRKSSSEYYPLLPLLANTLQATSRPARYQALKEELQQYCVQHFLASLPRGPNLHTK